MSDITAMVPAEVFPPGEFIREELTERGWSEVELAQILGRPVQAVSEILNGKKEITAATAVALGEAFGTSAELWLNLQAAHRLHLVRSREPELTAVSRRARLRALVPIRELQKLQWLPETDDLDALEAAVVDLLGVASIDEEPAFTAAARRANAVHEFTPVQVAWVARVRKLGMRRVSTPFGATRLRELGETLVGRIRDPYDLANLHSWLAEYGVSLVVEQPLKSSKIDGVVVFDDNGTPIVGLSTRGDRMDGFVFTLLHELAHLALGHIRPGEVRLDEDLTGTDGSDIEVAANELAASWIFPEGLEMAGGRPGTQEILAAARAHSVHPCFVIGRLQRDGRLKWSDLRRHVPKVRPFVNFG